MMLKALYPMIVKTYQVRPYSRANPTKIIMFQKILCFNFQKKKQKKYAQFPNSENFYAKKHFHTPHKHQLGLTRIEIFHFFS